MVHKASLKKVILSHNSRKNNFVLSIDLFIYFLEYLKSTCWYLQNRKTLFFLMSTDITILNVT